MLGGENAHNQTPSETFNPKHHRHKTHTAEKPGLRIIIIIIITIAKIGLAILLRSILQTQ